MNRPPRNLVQVQEKDLQPGQAIWWPMGPVQWGGMEYQLGKWIPSAVIFVVDEEEE